MLFKKKVNLPKDKAFYSGINADWKLEPSDTVQDFDSIFQDMLMAIGTRKGSRKWRERFGSYCYNHLMEPFDEITADWLKTSIVDALEDPYNGLTKDVTDVQCRVQLDHNTQSYYVTLWWSMPKLEKHRQKQTGNFRMRKM